MLAEKFRSAGRLPVFLILCGVLLMAGRHGFAQQASANVNGVVSDPTGAAVPNADVSLTNVDTSVARSTRTNSDGAYVFLNVVPGAYTISVSAPGFAPVKQSQVTLQVNQTATFDFHLQIGQAQQSVTVEAIAAAVESSTAELGTVVTTQEVNTLPLNGRNFTQLLTITPGVANVNRDQSGGGGGGFVGNAIGSYAFPSINGSRVRSNTFLLDGINNLNTFLTTYNFQPIIDDVQEFKTQTHNDLTEYGGVTGGIVNVVSKSGTNEYHGSLWEFLRNEQMDARGFFDLNRPPLRQNQFGAAAGGPIWIPKIYNGRNRSFFYAAYEAYRQRVSNEGGTLGPTDAMRAGDFSALSTPIYNPFKTVVDPVTGVASRPVFPGNKIPSNMLNPIALAYQNLVPHAGALLNGNNIYIPAKSKTDQDSGSIRADQYIRNSDQIMFRYSQYEQNLVTPNNVIGQGASDIYGHNMVIHETHTFGPTAILDVYFGRNFGNDLLVNSVPGETPAFISDIQSLGMSSTFSTLQGKVYAPSMSMGPYLSFPYQALQETGLADVWQFGGNFSKILGKHTIKAGIDMDTNNFRSPIGYANDSFGPTQTAGLGVNQGVGGNSWASFLLGVPGGAAYRNILEVNHGGWTNAFFVQDQWKATSRLTVNVGLRNEIVIWPIYGSGKDLYTGDADAVTGQYILTAIPPQCSATVGAPCLPNGNFAANPPSPYNGLPPHVVLTPHSDHRVINNQPFNWSGRLGLAYRLTDKTAIRAGYGRFYDAWGTVTQLAQNFGGNWPAVSTINNPAINQTTVTAPIGDPLGFGSGGALVYPRVTFDKVSQWMVDPDFKTPYMDQWNFGVQQQVGSSTVVDANYVGSVGRHLDWGPVQNVAPPGPGDPTARQPFPYMYPQWFDQSVGNSRYNALQVSVNRRTSKGMAFLVAYTLSRSVDDGCSLGANCNVQNVYDRASNLAVSDSNQTHVFSASFTLESPFSHAQNRFVSTLAGGWVLNGIVQLNSGAPYSVTTSNGILNNGGFNTERANVSGDPNAGGGSVDHWFNTAAFSNPAPYTYGNSKPNLLNSDWGRNVDLSLFRQFHVGLGERRFFEFRAEAFNAFNNVVFSYPDSSLTDTNFGRVTSQRNSPRELQLGLKFYF
ncbi:MAG TPA: carboxypeptidase-like regulatory domain-containing protein [Bryobacteraceae bacterium]|jgi:hypothetical protein|nr:carboxypeptidase-like regulatory domain-containing protein [Bryobacteraceae bacterium]